MKKFNNCFLWFSGFVYLHEISRLPISQRQRGRNANACFFIRLMSFLFQKGETNKVRLFDRKLKSAQLKRKTPKLSTLRIINGNDPYQVWKKGSLGNKMPWTLNAPWIVSSSELYDCIWLILHYSWNVMVIWEHSPGIWIPKITSTGHCYSFESEINALSRTSRCCALMSGDALKNSTRSIFASKSIFCWLYEMHSLESPEDDASYFRYPNMRDETSLQESAWISEMNCIQKLNEKDESNEILTMASIIVSLMLVQIEFC